MPAKSPCPASAAEDSYYAELDADTDDTTLVAEGVLTVPEHFDTARMANVAVLRSSLFGFANRNVARTWYRLAPLERDEVTGEQHATPPPFQPQPLRVVSLEGVEISYEGEALRQDDLSVALHLTWARQLKDVDKFSNIKPYEVVKALGWSHNKESVRRLAQSIWRMHKGSLTVNSARTGDLAGTHLINDCLVNVRDTSRPWKVKLGTALPTLLAGAGRFRYLRDDTRAHLPDFAQWLYGFVATQNKGKPMPKAIPLGTLFRIAGLNTSAGTFHENRRKVKDALTLLERGVIEFKPRGLAVAKAERRVKELDALQAQEGLNAAQRAKAAAEAKEARGELQELARPRIVSFKPGVAPGWELTGSTLNFTHI